MLSLFLSAVLTQNWSSFAPVLLDDPVTHFDDMNTYSLVDLLDGLISETAESPCRRQFLISTCEERFFRLLQQRFSGANDKAIFYVFESIGRDGPKIKRLD
jgi:exonuclease SbcC